MQWSYVFLELTQRNAIWKIVSIIWGDLNMFNSWQPSSFHTYMVSSPGKVEAHRTQVTTPFFRKHYLEPTHKENIVKGVNFMKKI